MPEPPPLVGGAVRGLVFDLDGTLIDSYGPIACSLNHARAAAGLPPLPEQAVRRRVGRGLESLIAELVGPDQVAQGVTRFRERYREVFADGTFVLPGVATTLFHLRSAGYRMAVASNKPARFSIPILERLELAPAFVCVLGPDLVSHAKPHPAMIRECLAQLETAPRAAAYVGDMELDVESAARAGVPVLLVPGGSTPAQVLANTGQRVLRSFSELTRLFPAAAG